MGSLNDAEIREQAQKLKEYIDKTPNLTRREKYDLAIQWINSKDFEPDDAHIILSVYSTIANPKKKKSRKAKKVKQKSNPSFSNSSLLIAAAIAAGLYYLWSKKQTQIALIKVNPAAVKNLSGVSC